MLPLYNSIKIHPHDNHYFLQTQLFIFLDHLDILQILSSLSCFMILLEENLITLTRMAILPHPLNSSHPFSRHNISYFQSSPGLEKKKKTAWQWFTKNCNLILWNNRLFICALCNDPTICHTISSLEKNNAPRKKRKHWQHGKEYEPFYKICIYKLILRLNGIKI